MKKSLLFLVLCVTISFALEAPKKVAYWTSWNGMNEQTGAKVAAGDIDGILLSFGRWDENGTLIGSDGMLDIPNYDKYSMLQQYLAWTQAKLANPNAKYLVAFGGQTYESIWDVLNTQQGRETVAQNLYNLVNTKFPVYKKNLRADEVLECKSTKLVDPDGDQETVWDNNAGTQQTDSDGNLRWQDWGTDNNGNACSIDAQNCPLMTGAMVPNPDFNPEAQCILEHYNVAGYVQLDGLDFDFEKAARITQEEGENLRITMELLRNKLRQNNKDKLLSLTTYHVGADPLNCSDNSNFEDCSFIETSRSSHHGEVLQLLNDSLGLFDFYNVMAYDAGRNFRWDVAINNYGQIVGKDKVNLGITINHQWAPDESFVESRSNNINRAKYVKDNDYLGYFVWDLGASTTQMSFSDQVLYMNDLGQAYNQGNNTFDTLTNNEARALFANANVDDLTSEDDSTQGDTNEDSTSEDDSTQSDTNEQIDIDTSLNLIQNGSFEQYKTISNHGKWKQALVDNWTSTDKRGLIEIWTSRLGKTATNGEHKIELDLSRGSIDNLSQTITNAHDMYKYTLSLDAYARVAGSSDFGVYINGKLVMSVKPNSNWVTYSTTFTGEATMTVSIREIAGQNNGVGAIIDNVRLVNTGVKANNKVQFVNVYEYGNLQTTQVRFTSKQFASDPVTYGGYIQWMADGETIIITKD